MSREEAIKIWLPIIQMGVENMPECKEALETAIKALEQEPCEYVVSRKAVYEILNDAYFLKLDEGAALQESVRQLPSVTAQPKMGRWNFTKHYGRDYYVCLVCGMERMDDHSSGWNYCPNCGTKMQEVEG